MIKRGFDIFGALMLLIIALIPMVIISVFILVDSGRPVFFIQQRMGRFERPFWMIKFRTMGVLKTARYGSFDAGDNSRVTRTGRFLREFKLDELPQLFNVLKGDMSLVGPRPEIKEWTEVYHDRWEKVLQVRPGITDNASMQFRNEERILTNIKNPISYYREVILPYKLSLYEAYVKNNNFFSDLMIILRTIRVLFYRENAPL
ncbi:sugar transferase [Marinilabilia rubra]|uniref:Bacterial sugar transferase domain-containing protein n=1 Tax=Marinilabilia rubra TaxID=2162893 RepID=A0A2U2B4M4_9BACT|nr:sugar transferase [Marinilabilia rubra]PWD98018.1 hypothetical protein DDZ16_17600 [Marinilabilia rubra]